MQDIEGGSHQQLYVQLKEYENNYNLKYIPSNSPPYCCCADGNICYNLTDSNIMCLGQCDLRFRLCTDLANGTMDTP